jgi:hypothetical protein
MKIILQIELQSLGYRLAIALQSLGYRFAIAWLSICNRLAIAIAMLRNGFAVKMRSLAFQLFCNRFGKRFAITLLSLCNRIANALLCSGCSVALSSLCSFTTALLSFFHRFLIALHWLYRFATAFNAIFSLRNRF